MNTLYINETSRVIASGKRKITIAIMLAIVASAFLAAPAFAFSDVFFLPGKLDAYNFGTVNGQVIGIQPAFVVIEGFTMKRGDTVPWHYHKGTSYVIVERGTISEVDYSDGRCSSEVHTAGNAFVEAPGHVHTVTNTGPGVAIVWWATVFPQSDGLGAGGTYFVVAPSCN